MRGLALIFRFGLSWPARHTVPYWFFGGYPNEMCPHDLPKMLLGIRRFFFLFLNCSPGHVSGFRILPFPFPFSFI